MSELKKDPREPNKVHTCFTKLYVYSSHFNYLIYATKQKETKGDKRK